MPSVDEVKLDIFKIITVIGPLTATSLAITHDVGFFVGIGIGFFSFFTLGEHIVFALQAIPVFIVPVAVFLMWYAGGWIGYKQGYKRGLVVGEEMKTADADM
jgi:hypothetical protein